jgi:light-regulated signal transduction histidine kinase (bacteriophytochrome)
MKANADARLIKIALTNLIANAWKFTVNKDHSIVEIASESTDGVTTYSVSDNGAGFNMDYADKLFGAFQRLHDAREFPGTGIGLATVQRVVHKHGGKVWAKAEENKGAVFYFTLEKEAQ